MRAKEILSPIQLKHIKEISEELLKSIQSHELEMPGIQEYESPELLDHIGVASPQDKTQDDKNTDEKTKDDKKPQDK